MTKGFFDDENFISKYIQAILENRKNKKCESRILPKAILQLFRYIAFAIPVFLAGFLAGWVILGISWGIVVILVFSFLGGIFGYLLGLITPKSSIQGEGINYIPISAPDKEK